MGYPYRVFISYSRRDRSKVARLVKILESLQLCPMWDEQLAPGVDFSPEILKFIVNCHVFLPFLTDFSMNRPWLNQEIGYAIALGKPLLPVTLSEMPTGMVSGLQTIRIRMDLSDVAERITAEEIERVVNSNRDRGAMYESTDDNAQLDSILYLGASYSASSGSTVPFRVQAYVETIVHTCADGGRALVSVVLFGSAAIGGWVEPSRTWISFWLSLTAPLMRIWTALRSEVERIETLHRLRSHSTHGQPALEKFLDRVTAHDWSFFICRRGDLPSIATCWYVRQCSSRTRFRAHYHTPLAVVVDGCGCMASNPAGLFM